MPTRGVETFETQWYGNGTARFEFANDDLTQGDFDRTALGAHDLLSEVFTDGDAVPAGVVPPFFVVRIGPGGTAHNPANPPPQVPPPVLTLDITNAGGPSALNVAIQAGLPEGIEYNLDLGAGTLTDLTDCNASVASKLIGTVQFFAPAQLFEDFEDGWPAPSPGML